MACSRGVYKENLVVIRPWFWVAVWPRVRLGVRPDDGYKLFSERMGLSKVWRVFGYAISFRRDPKDFSAPFFFGGWK